MHKPRELVSAGQQGCDSLCSAVNGWPSQGVLAAVAGLQKRVVVVRYCRPTSAATGRGKRPPAAEREPVDVLGEVGSYLALPLLGVIAASCELHYNLFVSNLSAKRLSKYYWRGIESSEPETAKSRFLRAIKRQGETSGQIGRTGGSKLRRTPIRSAIGLIAPTRLCRAF